MKTLITILLSLLCISSFAQGTFSGSVKDENGQALDAATVTLSRKGQTISALVGYGKFKITYTTPGDYELQVRLVGYKSYSGSIVLPADSLNVLLIREEKSLDEVKIVANKPVIERSADHVNFNVENSVTASGGTVWEAIKKAPGIHSGADQALTANQKNAEVYLDGRPLRLTGEDLASYLQGLPAQSITRIEVFTDPPARFEAQGGSVINIVTKKSKVAGLNGTLNQTVTQATQTSYNSSGTLNYGLGKINLSGSYSYGNRNAVRQQQDLISFNSAGNSSVWNSNGRTENTTETQNYRAGIDIKKSDKETIGILFSGSNRDDKRKGYTPTVITSGTGSAADSTLLTQSNTGGKGSQFTVNVNYGIKLDTAGRSLYLDMEYSPFRSSRTQALDSRTILPGGKDGTFYRILTPTLQNISVIAGKADYTYKVAGKINFTSGAKYSMVNTTNVFDFYNNSGIIPEYLPAKSDHFNYSEKTAGVYTSASITEGKWVIQGGLRAEFTGSRGYSVMIDSLSRRNYLKVFPTVYVTYKLNEANEFQLNYSYRIDRPNFALLNPGRRYANLFNYSVGNPGLQPAFIKSIELGYTYIQDYNITVYSSETTQLFTNVTVQDNKSKTFYNTFQNLGLSVATGLRFTATIHPAAGWEMSNYLDGYLQHERSAYQSGSYDYRKLAFSANTTQTFIISKKGGISAEITAYYTSPGISAIFKQGSIGSVDAGLKAGLFGGKGTLRLTGGDLFYTDNFRVSTNYGNQSNGFTQKNDTRNILLSFSFRFGAGKNTESKHTTSGEEEKNRAQ